jgi:hypothetical protein
MLTGTVDVYLCFHYFSHIRSSFFVPALPLLRVPRVRHRRSVRGRIRRQRLVRNGHRTSGGSHRTQKNCATLLRHVHLLLVRF